MMLILGFTLSPQEIETALTDLQTQITALETENEQLRSELDTMANYLMTQEEKAKLDGINEASFEIWSGSQAIADDATYDFFSALAFPLKSAKNIKVEILDYIYYTPLIAILGADGTGTAYYGEFPMFEITSTSTAFNVKNVSGFSLLVVSIRLYFN